MNERIVAKRPADTDTGARRGVPAARPAPEAPIPPTTEAEKKAPHVRPGDRIFRGLATGSGVFIVVLIGAIGLFLLIQAIPSLALDKVNFLTSREWSTGDVNNMRYGILDLLLVTVVSSAFALLIAMPIALGIALFLTQYAPRRLARPFAYVIDLLAAVPSIIYGLWGLFVLGPVLTPIGQWLTSTLGFIPLFAEGNVSIEFGGTIFTAGIVLAVMILPIITAVTREVFDRTPPAHVEGAIALGATKWEVVRTTVLPFGKAGYVSASMLGLGRALGETIALTIILSATGTAFGWSLFDGGATFASKIALAAPEFNDPRSAGAYIAAGLVLFVLTFLVNAAARSIVAGHKEYE
ncbi:phosphate ABC transporter permease subunit PstC [Saccharothrix coeruleofusca]|uniref:Phosphate transport system permease protein n=1 Tax=Saccharothrix coeruleofusca TaxID=33919 RepID=A0A918APZ0_9PSEU|nr:phosphate ABC transporter permease subunit PstC [Saccharothrix coeruleofusca]MBP2339629.1 phosphate transport system permease protein [Saccharothrix coeruleofusca]GGP56442.1 phosphate transport system permease protein [Saccharothrix coeruleofusca]